MYKKLERIKSRLKKALGRPWKVSTTRGPKYVESTKKITCCTNIAAKTSKPAIAVFLANSPSDIKYLIDKLETAAAFLESISDNPEVAQLLAELKEDE